MFEFLKRKKKPKTSKIASNQNKNTQNIAISDDTKTSTFEVTVQNNNSESTVDNASVSENNISSFSLAQNSISQDSVSESLKSSVNSIEGTPSDNKQMPEAINEDYDKALEVADNISKHTRYDDLTNQLRNTVRSFDKVTFKKSNLSGFLLDAEEIMNAESEGLKLKQETLLKLKQSVSAIDDIIRIEKLFKAIPKKLSNLFEVAKVTNEKITNINEDEEVMQLEEDINSSASYVKDIAYALRFIYDRTDILLDAESERESLKFYTVRYEELNSVFNNLSAKVTSIVKNKEMLDKKYDSYRRKVKSFKGGGLINLDWDGKKYNQLSKLRNELTTGYEQIDSISALIRKNTTSVMPNLINSNSEFSDYVTLLIPKLVNNANIIRPKYNEVKGKVDSLQYEIESITNDLRYAIEQLNTLY